MFSGIIKALREYKKYIKHNFVKNLPNFTRVFSILIFLLLNYKSCNLDP